MTKAPSNNLGDDATDRCDIATAALARLLALQAVRELEAASKQGKDNANEQEENY